MSYKRSLARIYATLATVAAEALVPRRLRVSRRGAMSGEGIGFGLVFSGAVLAIASLFAILFVPTATFPIIYGEMGGFFGGILAVVGLIVYEAA